MKKLMPLKMKKTGSNTSKEAPKRLKNIWKNKKSPAGLKHTEDKSGGWHEESFPYLKKRWTKRIFDWHPALDTSIKTRIQVGRPKRK